MSNEATMPEDPIRRQDLVRPEHLKEAPVPPLPSVQGLDDAQASTTFSHYRTGLSNHRTQLSEHRTQLSEFRTDLSRYRTKLSTHRTEMSKRRTGMSFQRTRLSAERTLMSVLRTSLSLISFGFTIFQFFGKLQESKLIERAHAARNFGTILVVLGTLMLLVGIVYHIQFMRGLRGTRDLMIRDGNIHGQSTFPVSYTLVVAFLVLLLGLFAVGSMMFRIGPLG